MKTMLKKIHKYSERGQAIILIAFSIIGLVAIVGLMIDGGIMLIEYARMKRAIDSASIAAASQFRKGFNGTDLKRAGEEFMQFNQSDSIVTIFTCDTPGTNWDKALCPATLTEPRRKLVRVTATRRVDFGFMRVVGFDHTTIGASSIGEAASIDMVLYFDTSSSMAYETYGDPNRTDAAVPGVHDGDDPKICNASSTKRCEPMGKVKDVAVDFVKGNLLFFPYDRVAVVASTGQQQDGTATRMPQTIIEFSDNLTEVENAIRSLKVFVPETCPSTTPYASDQHGICLRYDPQYNGQRCIDITRDGNDADPTTCGASNIGGGLFESGYRFSYARSNSFWVVIALFGGPANAGVEPTQADADKGICPGTKLSPTWYFPAGTLDGYTVPAGQLGFCRDRDSTPYDPLATHRKANRKNPYSVVYPAGYDADDFARDAADFITAPAPDGLSAVMFSICMGIQCRYNGVTYTSLDANGDPIPTGYQTTDPLSAEHLGEYMALHAGDDLTADPKIIANHGLYQYAKDSNALAPIFEKIADNIFTKISQ